MFLFILLLFLCISPVGRTAHEGMCRETGLNINISSSNYRPFMPVMCRQPDESRSPFSGLLAGTQAVCCQQWHFYSIPSPTVPFCFCQRPSPNNYRGLSVLQLPSQENIWSTKLNRIVTWGNYFKDNLKNWMIRRVWFLWPQSWNTLETICWCVVSVRLKPVVDECVVTCLGRRVN